MYTSSDNLQTFISILAFNIKINAKVYHVVCHVPSWNIYGHELSHHIAYWLPWDPFIHDDVIKWKHFRVTGPLCEEFTGHRRIPLKKVQWRGAWMVFFFLRLNKPLKQWWGWWFETLSSPLRRHCNGTHLPLDKMVTVSQKIFSNAFSWMNSFVFWLKFHWSSFLIFHW